MEEVVTNIIKKFIRKAFNKIGYDIHKIIPKNLPFEEAITYIIHNNDINVEIIFDVGANIGQSAIKFRNLFKDAKIYCFEPFEKSYKRILAKTQSDKNIHVFNIALAESNGIKNFYINEYSDLNTIMPSLKKTHSYHYGGRNERIIEVKVATIDEFVTNYSLPKINVLKIDIEGGELLCLQGASQTLSSENIDLIYLEVGFAPRYEGEPFFENICNYLNKYNYRFFNFYNLRYANNGQLRIGDALFLNPKISLKILNKYKPS